MYAIGLSEGQINAKQKMTELGLVVTDHYVAQVNEKNGNIEVVFDLGLGTLTEASYRLTSAECIFCRGDGMFTPDGERCPSIFCNDGIVPPEYDWEFAIELWENKIKQDNVELHERIQDCFYQKHSNKW